MGGGLVRILLGILGAAGAFRFLLFVLNCFGQRGFFLVITKEFIVITPEIIQEVTRRLVNVYNPLEIYLFGSYAWGKPDEDSDLDLLVIVEDSDEKKQKRAIAGLRALWGLEISKDLLVFTKSEFEQYASDTQTLSRKIKEQGKLIYARA